MYKYLLAIFLFLHFTLNSFANQPDIKLHEKCLYPTVMISTKKSFTYGSGCIIRSEKDGAKYKNLFLSCAHIFEDGYEFEVISFGYKEWSKVSSFETTDCQLYAIDRDHDLAVGVFYSSKEMPFADVEIDPTLYIGNEVYRIGCGGASPPRLDYGKVTQMSKRLRTSIFTIPGDSGSPVFFNNKIIGVMKSVKIVNFRDNPLLGFSISYATTSETIKEWSDHYSQALDFIWKKGETLPKLPFMKLEIKEYEVK